MAFSAYAWPPTPPSLLTTLTSPTFITDITVEGIEAGTACVNLTADEGDDNADLWRICVANDGDATLESFTSGAWVAKWTTRDRKSVV